MPPWNGIAAEKSRALTGQVFGDLQRNDQVELTIYAELSSEVACEESLMWDLEQLGHIFAIDAPEIIDTALLEDREPRADATTHIHHASRMAQLEHQRHDVPCGASCSLPLNSVKLGVIWLHECWRPQGCSSNTTRHSFSVMHR